MNTFKDAKVIKNKKNNKRRNKIFKFILIIIFNRNIK
jgi:hypothetical protein